MFFARQAIRAKNSNLDRLTAVKDFFYLNKHEYKGE